MFTVNGIMINIKLKKTLRFIARAFFAVFFCVAFCFISVQAAENNKEAEYITLKSRVDGSGFDKPSYLTDGDKFTYTNSKTSDTVITLESETGIGSLYIVFWKNYGEWKLSDANKTVSCGENGFLHEYVNTAALFNEAPIKLTLTFSGKTASIAEIFMFSEGEVPSYVQKWNPPCEKADLFLLSAHSDDDQLFFAGLLPYYAGEMGYKTQLVYFVNHKDENNRIHELLDGLWVTGVSNYPVIGPFPDIFCNSLEEAKQAYKNAGYGEEMITKYITELLRRFRPLVVVGHDEKGEYGHGTHALSTYILKKALEAAPDANAFPESAEKYGTWDVPKTYLHLYTENQIVMDWDKPLEHFERKTAFQVSQEAFAYHKSQHWTWFYSWLYGKSGNKITLASQINYCSPSKYGLFRTSVEQDKLKNDLFENIMTYGEQDAAEALAREEERLAAESEAARIEAERAAAESEAARIEAERLAAESEAALIESEKNAASEAKEGLASVLADSERAQRNRKILCAVILTGIIIITAAFIAITERQIRRR